MFEFLQRVYSEGKIGIDEINIAVLKNWITQEEADVILA